MHRRDRQTDRERMIRTLPVSEDAAGGDEAVNRVADGPDEDPELVPAVERLLLDAEYHRSQILVVGKVVPVLRAVKVLLVGLLLDRGELEALILLPLLLDDRLLPRHIVRIDLVLLEQAEAVVLPFQYRRTLLQRLLLHLLGIGRVTIALALVPDRVRGDLLPRALDPIARRRYQVVREFLAKFICEEIYLQSASIPNSAIHYSDLFVIRYIARNE